MTIGTLRAISREPLVRARKHLLALLLSSLVVCTLAALMLGPKLATARNINEMLWGSIGGYDYLDLALQDLALYLLLCGVTLHLTRSRAIAFGLWWGMLSALTLLLVVDFRSRSFWLKPIDLAQVRYFVEQMAALESSAPAFFSGGDAFGLSFKRLIALWALLSGVAFVAALTARRLSLSDSEFAHAMRPRTPLVAWLALSVMLGSMSLGSRRFIYGIEQNLLVSPLLRSLTPKPAQRALPKFEQPVRSLAQALAKPRIRLQGVAPFRNMVMVMLESFRYRDHELPNSKHTPQLARLAREGLWAKAYVSVPHSSKGHYAVLTGRAPSSGVEIREAAKSSVPAIFGELRALRGAATSAFSTADLGFENTNGLLEAAGVSSLMGPAALEKAGAAFALSSSYGVDDRALSEMPARIIRKRGQRPFATLLLTIDAHHPYIYPNKDDSIEDDRFHYTQSIRYTDRVLGEIVASFERQGLAESTLFVFVADHGESFGEHGTTIHNNSLYEEEVTVPLVFWSSDGRLRHPQGLEARQIDVAPTIADLMGIASSQAPVQGVSLLREDRPPAYISTFFEDVSQALVLDRDKFMYWSSNDRLVRFDLQRDPGERRPQELTGPRRAEVLARLRSAKAYEASLWGKSQ